MKERLQVVIDNIGVYGVWVLYAAFAGLTAFQLQATLIYIGLLIVENPDIRPIGWSTGTIVSINRILVLILGLLWLGVVVFAESYLRDGKSKNKLANRALRIFASTGAVYLISYLLLVLLS